MEKEKIIQGNELIAKFMGAEKENGYWDYLLTDAPAITEGNGGAYLPRELHYHHDWNWLMPVVKKINDLCNERGGELSNNSRRQEHLSNQLDNPLHWKSWSYHYVTLITDIDVVFRTVIKFIEWYNTSATAQGKV